MTLPEWQHLAKIIGVGTTISSLPAGANDNVMINSVYLPTLLAPIGALLKLVGLRATALTAGIIGLFYLLKLCRRFASPSSSLVAVGVATFSIPLLPYFHLFYMDVFLFALICFGWGRLQRPDRGMPGTLLTGLSIVVIPFVHMRGSFVAAALFLSLLWQLYRRGKMAMIVVLFAIAAAALVALVGLNFLIYHTITGPVTGDSLPLPQQLFAVLSMQLFSIHHGLFAYAPVWLLGFAGLWGGAARRVPIALQGLVLVTIAAITGFGVDPGECWPARYWVMLIPMLSVGFCVAWDLGKGWLLRGISISLIGATLVNTVLFFKSPNAFLENRQTTATYQYLFDKTGYFDFGLVLPVDVGDAPDVVAARNLALGAGIVIFFLALSLARRRQIYAAPAVLLILAALDLSRISTVPPHDYTATEAPNGFAVTFHPPVGTAYVQFGTYWQTWFTPPDWYRFSVTVIDADGKRTQELLPANQVVAASCSAGVRSLAVKAPPQFGLISQVDTRFVIYRSKSLLTKSTPPWLPHPC